jgi:hypothetical protein
VQYVRYESRINCIVILLSHIWEKGRDPPHIAPMQPPALLRTMISSAVIIPDAESPLPTDSPFASHKRRQSPPSDVGSSKRPRIDIPSRDDTRHQHPASPPPRNKAFVKCSGAVEERKRGQRLFGALLGTLSQSSATTSQRRRADIERKQLGKQLLREETLGDGHKRRKGQLEMVRRRGQNMWDEQSVRHTISSYACTLSSNCLRER